MAKPKLSNHLERHPTPDRRQLLTTGAAITAASIMPSAGPADASPLSVLPSLPPTPAQSPNFGAATARRLLEIERRNELRRESQLPQLSIARELRRMKEQQVSKEFERFETAHRDAVWEEILEARREAEGNPNWRVRNSFEGIRYQSEVYKTLRQQFDAESELLKE